jgi:hypothetical protein
MPKSLMEKSRVLRDQKNVYVKFEGRNNADLLFFDIKAITHYNFIPAKQTSQPRFLPSSFGTFMVECLLKITISLAGQIDFTS